MSENTIAEFHVCIIGAGWSGLLSCEYPLSASASRAVPAQLAGSKQVSRAPGRIGCGQNQLVERSQASPWERG